MARRTCKDTLLPRVSELTFAQMWETAGKAGMITANIMWYVWLSISTFSLVYQRRAFTQARPPDHQQWCQTHLFRFVGCQSVYDPLRIRSLTLRQEDISLSEKLDRIMAWIDLPLGERPQFISGLLFPDGFRTLRTHGLS